MAAAASAASRDPGAASEMDPRPELIAAAIEHGGFFELEYCKGFPPAIEPPEPRDQGCDAPTHGCVRDEAGRLLENGVGIEEGGVANKLLRYGYDEAGRLASMQVERSGHCISRSVYTRDAQGRIVREELLEGCGGEVAYWIAYRYDADGRLAAIEQVDHYGAPSQGTRTRILEYDDRGRLVGSREDDGSKVTLTYSSDGLCVGISDGGQLERRWERAPDGTVLAIEDRRFRSVVERDEAGRIVRSVVEHLDGSEPPTSIEFRHDAQGRCVRVTSVGETCDYDPPYPGPCPGELDPNPSIGCVVNY